MRTRVSIWILWGLVTLFAFIHAYQVDQVLGLLETYQTTHRLMIGTMRSLHETDKLLGSLILDEDLVGMGTRDVDPNELDGKLVWSWRMEVDDEHGE